MKKHGIGIFIAVMMTIFCSCGKKGCTDITALNYSRSANTDDGNCKYFSDDIIGTYRYYDSISGPQVNPPYNYGTSLFQIQRKSGNNAEFVKFPYPEDYIFNINIDSNHIIKNDTTSSHNPTYLDSFHAIHADFNFSSDTMYFTMLLYDFSFSLKETHWGYAVKQ